MLIRIPSVPDGEKVSEDFSIIAEGQNVPVHEARVSAVPFNRRWPGHQRSPDQSETACFALIEADGPVEVTVVPKRAFNTATVRPLSKGINPRIDGGKIRFTLPASGGYSVELDGFHNALHLFLNPVKTYDVNPEEENTIYFGPGIHDVGMLQLKSGQIVYIDAGAVVYACIHAENAEDIRILGQGILDNSRNREQILFAVEKLGSGDVDVHNSKRENTIQLKNVKNAVVDGITIRDSLLYNIAAFGCENLVVDNVKTIGCWRYNSDGVDLHNCSRCVVRNCFLRTYDDSICIKGHRGYPQVCEDILVENNTIWCDWGRALEIGAETCAERIHGITFRNCDIIRNTHIAMDILNVDYGDVYNILYEDIRVEYDKFSQFPRIQTDDEDTYEFDPDSKYLPELFVSVIQKHHEYSEGRDRRGRNHGITLRNIRITADRMPPSSVSGYDGAHLTSNVTIDSLFLNGKRLGSLEEANINIGPFTDSITLR